jgi:hypothetical protein
MIERIAEFEWSSDQFCGRIVWFTGLGTPFSLFMQPWVAKRVPIGTYFPEMQFFAVALLFAWSMIYVKARSSRRLVSDGSKKCQDEGHVHRYDRSDLVEVLVLYMRSF